MNGLKALVIFLGILIILGLGVLVYGIVNKLGALGDQETPSGTWENSRTLIEDDAEIGTAIIAHDTIVIPTTSDNITKFMIFDSLSGQQRGTITLERQ
ncbi:MAG: hypothetical protein AAF352_00045 [Pseudomonadota bacterium]